MRKTKILSGNAYIYEAKLKEEENFGIKDYKTYQKFGEKVYKIRENVLANVKKLTKKKKQYM